VGKVIGGVRGGAQLEQLGGFMDNVEFKKIKFEYSHQDQALKITLATPPGNVLDGRMMGEIVACLESSKSKPELKMVVFQGEGKHFCFGAGVEEHQKEQAPLMIKSFHVMFKTILSMGTPTAAIVKGQCLGGGMELASFCNFIFAEPGAKFGQPEIVLGVFPPVAAAILPGIIGQSRADDIILTGRSIDSETAASWGLVHTVAPNCEEAFDQFLAKWILPKSAESLRFANRASRMPWVENLGEALDRMESFYVNDLMNTHDANEGIESFIAKRGPEWKNR